MKFFKLSTCVALALFCVSRGHGQRDAEGPSDWARAYARKVDRSVEAGDFTSKRIKNPDGSTITFWRSNRVVVAIDETVSLRAYRPRLPEMGSFDEIAYKNGSQYYLSIVNPGELRLFYEVLARASYKESYDTTRSYFTVLGRPALQRKVEPIPATSTHFCGLGLFFRKDGKDLYSVSGHPDTDWFELRMSAEPNISNAALNALLARYTDESPLWRAAYGR